MLIVRSADINTLSATSSPSFGLNRPDPLRRFTSTLHSTDVHIMERTIHLESNDFELLKIVTEFFPSHSLSARLPDVSWRIVVEPDRRVDWSAPITAFADSGLSFVNFGQTSFLAFDHDDRKGIAFLSKSFVEHPEARFVHRPPLDILFCMSAATLGLTCLSAAAVAHQGKCVLLFGEPDNGKTTTSYIAARQGLQFFSDQVVFLESHKGGARAWGDPFPAVFRPKTLEFYPELRGSLRMSSYGDLNFYYFDKSDLQRAGGQSAEPLCTVFLRRGTSTEPIASLMTRAEASSRLRETILFREDDRFTPQHDLIFGAIEQLPAFCLDYDENPETAARFVQKLLLGRVAQEAP